MESCLDQMRTAIGRGDPATAERLGRAYLADDPGALPVLKGLSVALLLQGRFVAALVPLTRLHEANPRDTDVLQNIGRCYMEAQNWAAALDAYESLDGGEALTGRALALNKLNRQDEAADCYLQAMAVLGESPDLLASLADVRFRQFRVDEAMKLCDAALAQDPRHGGALINKAHLLCAMGRHDLVAAQARAAVAACPHDDFIAQNAGYHLLRQGLFTEGWPLFDHRPEARLDRGLPKCRGEDLAGQGLLLWARQGVGDALQFVRFVPLLAARGARIYLEAPRFLRPLLSSLKGVADFVDADEVPSGATLHAPLLSLGHLLGVTADDLPGAPPYLQADPQRVERWRSRLNRQPGLRYLGLNGQGNPEMPNDGFRSVPLEALEPLVRHPGVRLVNLHKGAASAALRARAADWGLIDFGADLDADGGAFLDTAALMSLLDGTISADTSTIHLAGALGLPGWLMLSSYGDWRWMATRDDSPWYPSVRIFRQDRLGDWAGVVRKMISAIVNDEL
ncbi:tetratricopeptide repeat protein [Magnetospira thiophila]